MTYDELMAIVAANNQYRTNEFAGPLGPQGGEEYYLSDPNNPLGTSVQRGEDGSLFGWTPRDAQTGRGGGDFVAYGPDGQLVNSGFREDTRDWKDSLFGAVGVLGAGALAGNFLAPALMSAGSAGTGGATMGQTIATAGGNTAGVSAGTGAVSAGLAPAGVTPYTIGAGAAPAVGATGAAGAAGLGGELVSGAVDYGTGWGPEHFTESMYGGPAPSTGMMTGPIPGDMPPGVVTPDGGIDWAKLSQAAASGFDVSKILPGLIGAGVGAAGSGPQTLTGTSSETINDPAYETFRNDTFNTTRDAARQPYAAPGFSLTQDNRPEQAQAAGVFGDFASGARDVTSAVNPLAAENNPYITGVINAGARDMTDAYARMVAPTYAGTSSFGNRNMGEYENADRSNLMMRIGDLSGNLRMQDHTLRANLLESGAGRADQIANANANRGLAGATGLANVGSTLFNQGQQNINNQYTEFQRQQLWGRDGAKLMQGGLNAPFNATRTSSQTQPGNRAAGALGGFTLGMQAGNLFGGANGNQRTARTAASLFG
jgi:hypothetical protein